MKTNFSPRLFLPVLATAACFTLSGLIQAAEPADQRLVPPDKPGGATLNPPEFSSWDDIKNLTHEQKAEFAVGLHRLELKLDKQIADLKEKRTTMKGENKDWDFAMKNLEEARAYLKSVGAETETATSENWLNQKEKLGRAWQSALEAQDKVKATTTQ